jgi:hypothetical protein
MELAEQRLLANNIGRCFSIIASVAILRGKFTPRYVVLAAAALAGAWWMHAWHVALSR